MAVTSSQRGTLCLGLALCCATADVPALAQSFVRIGVEFQIQQTGYAFPADLGMAANGDFVVVWNKDFEHMYLRRFDSAGMPKADEEIADSGPDDTRPAVGVAGDGKFIVSWVAYVDAQSERDIRSRRFDAAGTAGGPAFLVNTYTPEDQSRVTVAADADGDFVVAWDNSPLAEPGIFARRFTSSGVPQGGVFQVNTYTTAPVTYPRVAMDADGDFVLAWQRLEAGSGLDVLARRFNSAGVAQALEFQVNTFTLNAQAYPAVAMDDAGDFVLAWTSYGQASLSSDVFARRFSAAGVALGIEFQANPYTGGYQRAPAVSLDSDGDFVVVWLGQGANEPQGVFARWFDASGAPQSGELQVDSHTSTTNSILSQVRVELQDDRDFVVVRSPGAYLQLMGPDSVTRLGAEFRVNQFTVRSQTRPAAAVEPDGDFVVTWSGALVSGSGIYGRRFSSLGGVLTGDFLVNAPTAVSESSPAVASDDGGFVVTWVSYRGGTADIFARRYDPSGTAQATEFQVNSFSASYQLAPAIDSDDDGDFVIAWQSDTKDGSFYGVAARRFDSVGVAQGVEVQVNAYTSGQQKAPAIAMTPNGEFIVTWESTGQDGPSDGVFARRFSAAGVSQAVEFQVNLHTGGHQRDPAVATNQDGAFVIVWESYQDGELEGVFARRFDSAGVGLASEFQVNAHTLDRQDDATVTYTPDGGFVVVWKSLGQDGDGLTTGVFGRRFDSAGVPQGREFLVNSYIVNQQGYPTLAADAARRFVVAWQSNNQDGQQGGIFARRFALPPLPAEVLDIDGDGSAGALTDGLLALRFMFGFTGSTLTTGALGPNCSRCDAAAIQAQFEKINLDIDANGSTTPLTDGLLVLRYLFGFTGTTLTAGAVGPGCARCTDAEVAAHLSNLF